MNDDDIKVYYKDCRDMSELRDKSIQSVVTSPPYWNLRSYSENKNDLVWNDGWKGQLGLEPTPDMYIRHILEILDEVCRVLRDDGTVWFNIADTFATKSGTYGGDKKYMGIHNRKGLSDTCSFEQPSPKSIGLKHKDLCLIPARFVIAAQERGWYVRNDIIWYKRNPNPESVTDRCTKSHEYIFLLTKKPNYYYDQDAIREKTSRDLSWKEYREKSGSWFEKDSRGQGLNQPDRTDRSGSYSHPMGRNKRDVWDIQVGREKNYGEGHYARFPEKLPESCILAGTSPMACNICDAPWKREIKIDRPKDYDPLAIDEKTREEWGGKEFSNNRALGKIYKDSQNTVRTTVGWKATCKCDGNNGTGKCIVLDPFVGSGTTLWVAKKLKRKAVGYELNIDFKEIIDKKCRLRSRNLEGFF